MQLLHTWARSPVHMPQVEVSLRAHLQRMMPLGPGVQGTSPCEKRGDGTGQVHGTELHPSCRWSPGAGAHLLTF